jgi:hypothetical protein
MTMRVVSEVDHLTCVGLILLDSEDTESYVEKRKYL